MFRKRCRTEEEGAVNATCKKRRFEESEKVRGLEDTVAQLTARLHHSELILSQMMVRMDQFEIRLKKGLDVPSYIS
jgi:hypothetical protein